MIEGVAAEKENSFFQYKLGRKLTWRIVLFSSIVTLFLTVVQFSFEFKQLSKKLDEIPTLVDKTMVPALAEALWAFDTKQIAALQQGINQLDYVEANSLQLTTGESREYVTGQSSYTRTFQLPVERNSEPLGTLQLTVSIDQAFQHILNQAYIILLKNGLKTTFVVIFILILVKSLVGRHLLKMIGFMQNYQSGEGEKLLQLDRGKREGKDELDDLATEFNALNKRVSDENKARLLEAKKREEAEEHLIHLERIGTMGELATSLAHELNQPLAGIMGYSDVAARLSKKPLDNQEELKKCMLKIGDEAERAAEIIKRTRAFVKRDEAVVEPVELTGAIEESLSLVSHRAMQYGVEISFSTESKVSALIDKIQLQQVFVNLLTNAIQALSGVDNGRVDINLSAREGQVVIAFKDNGAGLTDQIASHLFEPFITTKSEGLGLGLVICKNIIEAAQGELSGENHPDGGAEFTIKLPAMDNG